MQVNYELIRHLGYVWEVVFSGQLFQDLSIKVSMYLHFNPSKLVNNCGGGLIIFNVSFVQLGI